MGGENVRRRERGKGAIRCGINKSILIIIIIEAGVLSGKKIQWVRKIDEMGWGV